MNHTTLRLTTIMVIVSSIVVVLASLIVGIPITSDYAYAASHCRAYKLANGQDRMQCSASNGEVCTNYTPTSVVCTNGGSSSQSSPPDNSANQPNSLSPPMTNSSMTSSDPSTLNNDHG
jgi:hypothetical protein